MNADEDINNEDVELGVVKLHEEGPSDKEDVEEQKLIRSGEKIHHLERMSQYKTYAKVGKLLKDKSFSTVTCKCQYLQVYFTILR